MEQFTQYGVPGIIGYLIVRETFAFIRYIRNGNARRSGNAGCGGDREMVKEHATMLARHDQAINGIATDIKRIDRRLERIESYLHKEH